MEECSGLVKLTRTQERVLIDCFQAMDEGATVEECFVRYPQRKESLRGYLVMRDQLLALKATAPSPVAFASGREALLARVVRPLANGHPGSIDAQGRPARGVIWRPAARAALAGTLLFALAACALGVSATGAGERLGEVLPGIPTFELPPQQPPYPFPKLNDAPPVVVPTEESSQPADVAPTPPPAGEPSSDPAVEPNAPQDGGGTADDKDEPAKTDDPNAGWVQPQNANEETPVDTVTPTPTDEPLDDGPGHHDGDDGETPPSDGDVDNDVLHDSPDDASDSSDDTSATSLNDEPAWPDAILVDVTPAG